MFFKFIEVFFNTINISKNEHFNKKLTGCKHNTLQLIYIIFVILLDLRDTSKTVINEK